MALGSESQDYGKLYILKLRTQDADKNSIKPQWDILEKNEDGWEVTNHVTRVSGDLISVKTKEVEWKDGNYWAISLLLRDDKNNESYLVDLRLNILSRNIFNSVFALESYKNISIGLYEKASKKDKKVYPQTVVRQGEELVKGKFKIEELPEIKKFKVGGKTVVDTSELDAFIIENLNVVAEKVKESVSNKKVNEDVVNEEETESGSDVADLLFGDDSTESNSNDDDVF